MEQKGEERKKKKKKKKRKEKQIQGMENEFKYGCLTLVWNYECLNGILKFM